VDYRTAIGVAAGAMILAGYAVYIIGMLRSEGSPRPVTWSIWALTDLAILGSFLVSGAHSVGWMQLGTTAGNVAVTILSIRRGLFRVGRIDVACFLLAFAAITALVMFHDPAATLLFGLASKTIGFIPTGLKLWFAMKNFRAGDREFWPTWTLWAAADMASIFAVQHFVSIETLVPVQYSAQCLLVLYLNSKIPKSP